MVSTRIVKGGTWKLSLSPIEIHYFAMLAQRTPIFVGVPVGSLFR